MLADLGDQMVKLLIDSIIYMASIRWYSGCLGPGGITCHSY